jgi:hypothetical protein
VGVDRLATGDLEQPAAQVVSTPQPRIGPQCGQERLLEDVVGLLAPDACGQEPEHGFTVLLEHRLEGR